MGKIKFKNLFVDGTKIEAYANKYTFVWKKAVEKNLVKLSQKIEAILKCFIKPTNYEISKKERTKQIPTLWKTWHTMKRKMNIPALKAES